MVVGLSVLRINPADFLSATTCIDKLRMDSSRDRESVLRRRRERYRLQRARREGSEIRVPTLRLFGVGGDVLNVQVLSTSQNPVISDGNCYNDQCCVTALRAYANFLIARVLKVATALSGSPLDAVSFCLVMWQGCSH